MDGNDFLIDDGTVSNIQCDINGATDQNDTSYSKLYLASATRSNLKGFTITFQDVQGYLLADDGLNEVNATTDAGTSVSNFSQLSGLSTRGSVVESNLMEALKFLKVDPIPVLLL